VSAALPLAVVEHLSSASPEGVLLDISAVVMLLCAFACLGSKLFDRYVVYYGIQSVVLSFAAGVVAYHENEAGLWVLAALTFLIKGIGIPYGTRHFLLERFALKRDVALSTGLSSSLILGAFLTAFAFLTIRSGTVPHGLVAQAVVPISTAVILLGGLCMVVRRHTIAQLIGWLIIENGVFLGAIAIVATFPFIVEAGIFLDLVAAVLIMIAFVSGLVRRVAEAAAPELRQLSE
jgi:hydrogenase-4 component E